jgi:tetratricopeptide (TPR) repeat protein
MKKIFYVSGSLAAILLVLFLIGAIDFSESKRDKALSQGNRLMESGRYREALEAYERGLEDHPRDAELNYNSGHALYSMGDYSGAEKYYEASELPVPDRYLKMGNCRLNQGDYGRAAKYYMQGILEFPQDVPLKYNYEFAQEQIQQTEQQGDGEGEQGDGEGGQDDGEGEQGDGEGEQDDGEGGQDGGEGGQDDGEGEQGDGEGEQDDGQGEQQGIGEDDAEAEQRQTRSVIEHVLEALEKQEADSLKNNRNRNHIYEEGQYEW